MRAKIMYFILLVLVGLLFLWGNGQSTLLFVAILVAMIPLVVVENYIASKYLKAEITLENMVWKIVVKNSSIFPAFRVKVNAVMKNRLTGSSWEMIFEESVGPKQTMEHEIPMESLYCGKIESDIASLMSYDFLGLQGFNFSYENHGTCYAFPKDNSLDVSEMEEQKKSELNIQNRYLHKKGNDITQILDIRKYQKGDNIKTVHWKLSKKLGKKMVKELDMPANQEVLLVLALSEEAIEQEEMLHKLVQKAWNVSDYLLQEQVFFDTVLMLDGGATSKEYSIQEHKAKEWYQMQLLEGNHDFQQEYIDSYMYYHSVFDRYASVLMITDEKLGEWHQEEPQVLHFYI